MGACSKHVLGAFLVGVKCAALQNLTEFHFLVSRSLLTPTTHKLYV